MPYPALQGMLDEGFPHGLQVYWRVRLPEAALRMTSSTRSSSRQPERVAAERGGDRAVRRRRRARRRRRQRLRPSRRRLQPGHHRALDRPGRSGAAHRLGARRCTRPSSRTRAASTSTTWARKAKTGSGPPTGRRRTPGWSRSRTATIRTTCSGSTRTSSRRCRQSSRSSGRVARQCASAVFEQRDVRMRRVSCATACRPVAGKADDEDRTAPCPQRCAAGDGRTQFAPLRGHAAGARRLPH